MSELSPIYMDLLVKHGVLENAPKVHIDSNHAMTSLSPKDSYEKISNDTLSPRKFDSFYEVKKYGAIALLTYLVGVACSKGRLNPIDGVKGIYNVLVAGISKFAKIFKKA